MFKKVSLIFVLIFAFSQTASARKRVFGGFFQQKNYPPQQKNNHAVPSSTRNLPEQPPSRPIDDSADLKTNGVVSGELDPEEKIIATNIKSGRPNLSRSAELDAAARERAKVSAQERATGWTSHWDRQGNGPNYYARKNGFALPAYMANNGNQIESIAWGQGSGSSAWTTWMHSPPHAGHILGTSMGADHTHFGVGHYYSLQTGHVWVVMTAPKAKEYR